MTCCVGKARIYYKEPIGFQLRYKPNEGGWTTIIASEPLVTTCNPETQQNENVLYRLTGEYVAIASACSYDYSFAQASEFQYINLRPPIGMFLTADSGTCPNRGSYYRLYYYHGNPRQETEIYIQAGTGPFQRIHVAYSYTVSRMDGGGDSVVYTFKVTGANTGTEYVNISGLTQCPEVDNQGCVMGEEKYIDVDMAGLNSKILRVIPGFGKIPILTVYRECIKTKTESKNAIGNFTGSNRLIIQKTLEVEVPFSGFIDTNITSVVKTILYPDGCPPPPIKVVCTSGDDEKKCPPDTDCEVNCGSFKCCWKNGKLIKEISL